MVLYEVADFNSADNFFDMEAAEEWGDLESIISTLIPQLQPSDQSGKIGIPIFDPKATNALLTKKSSAAGWQKVPVPPDLRSFGLDWDAGRSRVLAEWQFSNYPFLWNNIIRSEAVFKSPHYLSHLGGAGALVIVTKSGSWPASNSTLYYEQARAQIETVTQLGVFDIPIRLVGLMIPPDSSTMEADWNTYPGRYSRITATHVRRIFQITWGGAAKHGNIAVTLS